MTFIIEWSDLFNELDLDFGHYKLSHILFEFPVARLNAIAFFFVRMIRKR